MDCEIRVQELEEVRQILLTEKTILERHHLDSLPPSIASEIRSAIRATQDMICKVEPLIRVVRGHHG